MYHSLEHKTVVHIVIDDILNSITYGTYMNLLVYIYTDLWKNTLETSTTDYL